MDERKVVVALVLVFAAMAGLYFKIEHSGWVLTLGILAFVDAM